MLTDKNIVFPIIFIGKLYPRAYSMEIISNKCYTSSITNNIVMSGHKIETYIILLAKFKIEINKNILRY